MEAAEKNLNALMIFIIACVLIGAFCLQIFLDEVPCPLCYLQRLSMIGVAIGALLNLVFGVRKRHYGLSLISAISGGFVALRQIAFHVCPGFPKFGVPFWGLSLYTWSFLIFCSSVAYIGILQTVFDHPTAELKRQKLNWWHIVACVLISIASLGNIASTLYTCGLGACKG